MTRVVNIYKNKYDVYIGRSGKGQEGYFGNLIKCNEKCLVCQEVHIESGSTIVCFKEIFLLRIDNDIEYREKILSLKDKTLGCFCKPKPCHGDVIVEWLESEK